MLDKFRESQRFSLHSAIINIDVSPQSRDRLQCCRFISEGIERSDDDSAMLSLFSRTRFSPAVLPNIGTLTTRRTNETSFLHACSLNVQRRNYSSEPTPCCIGTI